MPTNSKGNPLIVDLNGTKVVKTIGSHELKASSLKIRRFVDSPVDKTVEAFIIGAPGKVMLWEGAAYDAIGQWTETDVANRLRELFP